MPRADLPTPVCERLIVNHLHAIRRDRLWSRSVGWLIFLAWAFASALWIGWRLTHG